jgi:DNA-binding IclR family transcriptional regulator
MGSAMKEERKYWVPAVEKAHRVLQLVAGKPGHYKLIDLSRGLDINKSSMFSLLNTMEELQWVRKDSGDTYVLGMALAGFGSAFTQHFDLHALFQEEAATVRDAIQETVQMARLSDDHILYLGKVEANSPVRLLSEPGMRLPAHVTAMGKVLLALLSPEEFTALFPNEKLEALTPHSFPSRAELAAQLALVREEGVGFDNQEAVMGFRCVAAPVYNKAGKAEFAVSCSMPLHQWDSKAKQAEEHIRKLAKKLSYLH